MAYSKVSNKSQDKDVKYLSKDYNSYKNKLIDFLQPFVIAESNHFTQDRYIKLISKKLNLKKSYVDNRINFQGDNTWDN